MGGCKKPLAEGQWWKWCGETDMGQTLPVLCTHCGGSEILKEDINHDSVMDEILKYKKDSFELRKKLYPGKNEKWFI